MLILVIDDSKTIRVLAKNMLEEAGHQVLLAENPTEALQCLTDYPTLQLVFIDWVLPEISGLELAGLIRQQFSRYIYQIMLSAKDGGDNVLQALEAGVDDFMGKPFTPREMYARINVGLRIVNLENRLRENLQLMEWSKREWEATTDALSQLVCLVDEECVLLRTNAIAELWQLASRDEDIYGYPLVEILGRKFPVFAAQFDRLWAVAEPRLRQGEIFEFEGIAPHADRYFNIQCHPVSTTRGNSFAAVSIQDITERKRLALDLQNANQELEMEHQKSEGLLLNILPQPIAERLKSGEGSIAESFDNVTVLFADIVGFTELSTRISPAELVTMLNDIFSAFDFLADQFAVEKIKTIGDSYMVVGGVPVPQDDHAHAILNMAVNMLAAIEDFNQRYRESLSIRIGIASGPVVAGVIGAKKFVYDLWGDTVNTASRMEASGVAGNIHISPSTFELLQYDYLFESRGLIDIKGKGQIETYLLVLE